MGAESVLVPSRWEQPSVSGCAAWAVANHILLWHARPFNNKHTTPHAQTTMSLQHFGKATLRVAKNYTKGYSDVQTKVRDATSNDPWGPTGQQMNEIAQMTYNQCVLL